MSIFSKKPKIKKGASVRINDGVKDHDLGMDMSGWQGRIIELKPDDQIMLIAFDSHTLRNLPREYVEQCEEEGMDWAQYYIGYDEVTPAEPRDKPADVKEAVAELNATVGWSYLGEEGREINKILEGIDLDDEMAMMERWRDHFERVLTFPFKARVSEWQEPGSRLRSGDRVTVLGIEDVVYPYGVLVKVKRQSGTFVFPLCDLKALNEGSPNHDPLQLYAVWYANR